MSAEKREQNSLGPPLKRFALMGIGDTIKGDVWFEDGDIVLKCATNKKEYQIYLDILRLHSSTFRSTKLDVAEFVRPSDSWEIMVPLLCGLRPLYDGISTTISLVDMIAILRLGRRYRFEEYTRLAVAQLRDIFTYRRGSNTLPFLPWLSVLDGREIEVLDLVVHYGFKTLLPMAYMMCVCVKALDRGTTDRDGLDVYIVPTKDSTTAALRQAGERIVSRWYQLLDDLSPLDCDGQDSDGFSDCESTMLLVIREFHAYGFLEIFDLHKKDRMVQGQLCLKCQSTVARTHGEACRKMYEELPTFFNLPEWSKLVDNINLYL